MGSLVSDANSRNVRRVRAGSSETTVIFQRGGKRQCVPAIVCYSSPAYTPIFHPSLIIAQQIFKRFRKRLKSAFPAIISIPVVCASERLAFERFLRVAVSSVRDYFAFASTVTSQLKNTRLSPHLCNRINIPVKNENPSATCQKQLSSILHAYSVLLLSYG